MENKPSLRFPVGKLPIKTLERMLKRNKIKDPRVIVGPGIGEDAAVIDTGGPRYLIAKTDPITFTADQIGWYAVHINANDIATKGARPLWYLATLLLPEDLTTEDLAEQIFKDTLKRVRASVSLWSADTLKSLRA
jgi:hydrogenase expression/formation protein HypE